MLDRGADLHVGWQRFVVGPATGLVGSVEQLQPEVQFRQHTYRAHSGNADLGSGALADAEVGHAEVETWQLQASGASGRCSRVAPYRALLKGERRLGEQAQRGPNCDKTDRSLRHGGGSLRAQSNKIRS